MTELKQLDIAHKFCQLLQLENTGSRKELAQQLGITPRWVTVYKRKIEKIYRVEIHYHRKSRNFYLSETDRAKLPPPLFRVIINCRQKVKGSVGIPNGLNFVLEKPKRAKVGF